MQDFVRLLRLTLLRHSSAGATEKDFLNLQSQYGSQFCVCVEIFALLVFS